MLNSRVAHIHARRPRGARWKKGMTPGENRSANNLLLLCIPHSYEIDEHPERFPAEMLQQWRLGQRQEHHRLRKSWPLSDDEAQEAAQASFEAPELNRNMSAELARAVERLAVSAGLSRPPVAAEAMAWRRTWDKVRVATVAWDQDGNRIFAEPSRIDTERHKAALQRALGEAKDSLQPYVQDVKVEAAAARAAAPRLARWCEWLTRAADDLINAASVWPGPPPADDDSALPHGIDELRRAADALTAAMRRDPAPEPPPVPAPVRPDASTGADDNRLRRHEALLERARPYIRVQHRPYDADLRALLAAAAQDAATIPPVYSAMGIDLRATTRMAAAVARNADPTDLGALIKQDQTRRPLCVAVALLRELRGLLAEQGAEDLARIARDALVQQVESQDWSQAETWAGNECHGRAIFAAWASSTSADHPREHLAAALRQEPKRLRELLLCCAEWIERHDTRTGAARYERVFEQLPEWFPTDVVRAAAAVVLPDVTMATDRQDDRRTDEIERLLAHVLRLASLSTADHGAAEEGPIR